MDNFPMFEVMANSLVDAIIEHDDEMGHIANAKPDELRDALRAACDRLRGRPNEHQKVEYIIRYRLISPIYHDGRSNQKTRVLVARTDAEARTEVQEWISRPWAIGTLCRVERMTRRITVSVVNHEVIPHE